jgi:predicted RNA binding protein YcfA (HicA-like mRNA interferase family)
MTELPVVTPRRLLQALERAGFFVHHIAGSHYYLKHADKPGIIVVLPYHTADLKRGTLHSILKHAGLTVDDLLKLL